MNRSIVVVDNDPNWLALYEVEKAHILGVLGAAVFQIEYIGSTSLPGLSAKPVIDIAVGIAALTRHPSIPGGGIRAAESAVLVEGHAIGA